MIYVGQFISPIVLGSIEHLINCPLIRFQYFVLAVALFVSVLGMLNYKFSKRKQSATS